MSLSKVKKIVPLSIGSTLEAYDFCLYGLLAPVFAKVFFPPDSKYSLIAAFILFAIAYLSRPLGSVLWGHIADRYGRKIVLISTLSIMAVTSIGITILPGYKAIGIYSSIAVLLLRFIQGIAFGGEFPTTMVMLYEMAPKHLKGFFCSFTSTFTCVGKLIGIVLIIALLSMMESEAFYSWGWRLLFGVSIFFVIIIGYIRANLSETLAANEIQKTKVPFLEALHEWRIILFAILFYFVGNILFFSYSYHTSVLVKNTQGLTDLKMYAIQAFMMVYLIITLPIMSYIGDSIGRITLIKYTLISVIVLIFPVYYLILNENFYFIGILLLGIFVSTIAGLYFSVIVEYSKKNCRVSMVGMIDGLSTVTFGATAPLVNELLKNIFNNDFAPSYYIMIAAIISFFALNMLGRKQQREKLSQ